MGPRIAALCAVLLGAALLLAPAAVATEAPAAAAGTVDVVEVTGVLDAPTVRYIRSALEDAAAAGSEALVLRLDSPGTLGADAVVLAEEVAGSAVPVVAYVGPPGAAATGGAALVAHAADVLALAPLAVLGDAVPLDVGGGGPAVDEVRARLDELASASRRDPVSAASAADGAGLAVVPEGEDPGGARAALDLPPGMAADDVEILDERDAVDAGAVDVVAATLQGVLFALDGLEVGGEQLGVDPATASVRFVNQGLWGRILHTAASPTLAYLLLLGGLLALAFEVFQPGFGVAGVCALVVLALGSYALVVLPVRLPWLLAAIAGVVLLGLDLALARLGPLSAGGTALLGLGSWFAFRVPGLRPPLWLVVVGTAFGVVYFVAILTPVLRAQGSQALRGAEAVTGTVGVVRSVLNPEGHVFVGGQLWRARAPDVAGRVRTGTKVRVLGLQDDLTLAVEVVEEPDAERSAV